MKRYLGYVIIFIFSYLAGSYFPLFQSFYEIQLINQSNYAAKLNIMPDNQYSIIFTLNPKSIKKIKIYNNGDAGYSITANLNGKTLQKSAYLENNKRQILYINESQIGKNNE